MIITSDVGVKVIKHPRVLSKYKKNSARRQKRSFEKQKGSFNGKFEI